MEGRLRRRHCCYTQAIEFDPGYAPAYLKRGTAKRRLRRYDDAIVDLDQAIALAPEDASEWLCT